MSLFRVVVLAALLAASGTALAAGVTWAQGCGAYADEMAGPDGSYVTGAECAAVERAPERGVGIAGPPEEITVAGRDNPDAPAVYRDTATDEGEVEH